MSDRTIASRPSLEQVVAIIDFMENHSALGLGQLKGLEGRHQSKKLWCKLTRLVNTMDGPTRPMKSWVKSRPSLEQVVAIIDFMENHSALGLGQLKGLEGRHQSKKLWCKLTRLVNTMDGPTRPMKSWVKYWADKKSTVRAKVVSSGGDPNHLTSNVEKRIWDLFLTTDEGNKNRNTVKLESQCDFDFNEDDDEEPNLGIDTSLSFEEPVDLEERQMVIMEKLVRVMSTQADALTQVSQAALAHAHAMEKIAEASDIQAKAIDRLADTFSTISGVTHDVRDAIVDIDASLKRFYTEPT